MFHIKVSYYFFFLFPFSAFFSSRSPHTTSTGTHTTARLRETRSALAENRETVFSASFLLLARLFRAQWQERARLTRATRYGSTTALAALTPNAFCARLTLKFLL
jgi:hypothetical protein